MLKTITALALAIPLAAAPWIAAAEDAPSFHPKKGDTVIIYTHQFNPDDFEAGVKLVEEGFQQAAVDAGHKRRAFVLIDAESHKLVGVSFQGEGANPDEWHAFEGRIAVLEKLKTMHREPFTLEKFTLDTINSD